MSAGGEQEPVYVEDVFRSWPYDGNSSSQTISNDIDLAGSGGMVWVKSRFNTRSNFIVDTVRGISKTLSSDDSSSGETTDTTRFTAFNSDGFSVGGSSNTNNSGEYFLSRTFRKQKRFFDVVTYTGNDTSGRTVTHGLGSTPGVIIVRRTDSSGGWVVYHRSLGATKALYLQSTNGESTSSTNWNDTEPTSTNFTLGNSSNVNASGASYVAYLFAHNDGDGGFGELLDQDIIKCGSITRDVSTESFDIGFEPQWVMLKRTDASGYGWEIFDAATLWAHREFEILYANSSSARNYQSRDNGFHITNTGFKFGSWYPTAGPAKYAYIAIRKGYMRTPDSANKVFSQDTQGTRGFNDPSFNTSNPKHQADFAFRIYTPDGTDYFTSRRTGSRFLSPYQVNTESSSSYIKHDFPNGWYAWPSSAQSATWSAMWKNAKGFFDVCMYDGTAPTPQAVPHSLGVTPEMVIVKGTDAAFDWYVYHKDAVPNDGTYLRLNRTSAAANFGNIWFDVSEFNASTFGVGNMNNNNNSGSKFIAYLFASCDGVAKVGSYTGNQGTLNIDCGFTNGASFVLIKRYSSSGAWHVYSSLRGISTGNDPYSVFNSMSAEVTNTDYIEPYSAGFTVNDNGITNLDGASYLFYAVAAA